MPHMRPWLAVLVIVVLAAACGDDDAAPGDDAAGEASRSSTSSTVVATTSPPPATDPPAATDSAEATTSTLALPAETTMIEIEVGEYVFDARAAGPEDGELVLLLHGFPQTSAMWKSQVQALGEAGYRAVAPDQRGYSPRARPPEIADYVLPLLVADTAGMADALGAEEFHLVGHDWGGALAWVFAAFEPDRLASLTVVSTPHVDALADALADPETDQAERSSYVDTFVQPGSEALFLANDAALLRNLYEDAGLSPEEMADQLSVLDDEDAMRSALNWYRANTFGDVGGGSGVGPATMPTMFIWSDEDFALGPEAAAATADHVTGPYRFEILEGVNHWVPEVAADEVDALLLDFLADPAAS